MAALSYLALLFLGGLTFQNGLQSWLTGYFLDQSVAKISVVIFTELLKIIFGLSYLHFNGLLKEILDTWTLKESLRVAGLPASVYAIQNIFYVNGAQNLDGLTFNLINQTKSVSAAIFLFFVMGKRQSFQQIFALCLLFSVGIIISMDNENTKNQPYDDMQYNLGIICCLTASVLSGFAASLVQKAQQAAKSTHAFFYSAELGFYSISCLIPILLFQIISGSGDGYDVFQQGLLHGYSLSSFIPIFTNSIGGLLVGLVVKYAGSINKGYACMMGLVLSGAVRSVVFGSKLTWTIYAAVPLVAFAMWVNLTYPHTRKAKQESASKEELKGLKQNIP